MIEIYNCYAKLDLGPADFTKVVKGINDKGFESVIYQSKIKFLATAGITEFDDDILEWIGYYNIRGGSSFIFRTDLFIEEKNIIYISNESSGFSNSDRRIEIGVISEAADSASKILLRYVKEFENSLKANIDGRRVRHMKIKWYEFSKNSKLDTHVSFYRSFTYPVINNKESTGAMQLTDKNRRQTLRKIAEQESLKGIDIKGDQKEHLIQTINDLISCGLVVPKFIITCRKKSLAIGAIMSIDEIKGPNTIGLSCPHCGRNFADELIQQSFILSELGRKLNFGSHWMTILITNTLIEAGIPEKSIIWNLTEESEEVDCVVQFKDQVWIFELKDRDFEPGDAHPLAYRAVKFKADRTVIFTTGKVTKEARKVLQEMSTQSRDGHLKDFLYIEGVSSLSKSVKTMIKNETLLHISKKSQHLSKNSGMDFSLIFLNSFGKYSVKHQGEFKQDINIFSL